MSERAQGPSDVKWLPERINNVNDTTHLETRVLCPKKQAGPTRAVLRDALPLVTAQILYLRI